MANDLPTPKLYAEHVPDMDRTLNADRTVSEVELPGFLVIGVQVGDARIELTRIKGGQHVDDQGNLTFLGKAKSES